MKRNSLTAVIGKAQLLTVRATNKEYINLTSYGRIRKAAVNEIIRLDSSTASLPNNLAYKPGADPVKHLLNAISEIPGYEHLKNQI